MRTGARASRILAIVVLSLIAGFVCYSVAPAQSPPAGTEADAVRLDSGAASDREFAAGISKHADDWEAMATKAEQRASSSTNPVAKDIWEKTAQRHRQQAQIYRDQAKEYEDSAAAKSAQAAAIRAQLSKSESSPVPPNGDGTKSQGAGSTTPPAVTSDATDDSSSKMDVSLDDLLGTWRSKRQPGSTLVITLLDPLEKRNSIEVKGKYEWTGMYLAADASHPSRISLNRDPKVADMNPAAPKPARDQVLGQLKWRLELDVQPECPLCLKGKWYRGEIGWTGDADSSVHATATNQVKDIEEEFVKESKRKNDPDIPFLVVRTADSKQSLSQYLADPREIQYVTKGEPFFAELRTDSERAKQLGSNVTIKFASSKTGKTAEVQLTQHSYPGGVVIYSTSMAIKIRDPKFRIAFFSEPADHIGLSAGNDDEVVVSYKDVCSTHLRVYDDWVSLGIGEHERGFIGMLAVYNTLLEQSKDPKSAEMIRAKIAMIGNARHIINEYQPKQYGPLDIDFYGTFDKFTSITRYYIGKRYFALLLSKIGPYNFHAAGVQDPKAPQQYKQQFGIDIGSPWEGVAIDGAIADASVKLHKHTEEMFKELLQGEFITVQIVASLSPVVGLPDAFRIVIYGKNLWGSHVDQTDRILTAVGLGSQLILTGVGVLGHLEAAFGKIGTLAQIRRGAGIVEVAEAEITVANRALPRAELSKLYGGVPFDLEVQDGASYIHSTDCPPNSCGNAAQNYVAHKYGDVMTMPDGDVVLDPGRGWHLVKEDPHYLLNTIAEKTPDGLSLLENQEYLQWQGATVRRKVASMDQIGEILDQRRAIILPIKYAKWIERGKEMGGECHAVALTAVLRNASGKIQKVKFWDVNAGTVVTMRACDFEELRNGGTILDIEFPAKH